MEACSAQFVWFALTFSPLLYKLTVLLFLWVFFFFALLFILFQCSASFAVCLLSFHKQKKNKNQNERLGPSGPVVECHLVP